MVHSMQDSHLYTSDEHHGRINSTKQESASQRSTGTPLNAKEGKAPFLEDLFFQTVEQSQAFGGRAFDPKELEASGGPLENMAPTQR